jgi:asparagine synthase (glutamine-hydrolysing)
MKHFTLPQSKKPFSLLGTAKIADEGLQEYIFNRFVAGENTLYENISKVLPGHSMTLHQNGKIETEKWWDLKMKFKIKP